MIAVQAAGENVAHVGLGREERSREKAGGKTLAGAGAGLRDTPAQDLAEPRIDPSRAFDVVEILAVYRLLEERRAAFAELFPHPPEALLLGLEGEIDEWIVGSGPRNIGIGARRGVRQQEREADGVRQRRFSEIVGTVEDVQSRSERDLDVPDRGEILHSQMVQPHRPPPDRSFCRCTSL